MKISKIAVSAVTAISLTLTAIPANVDASMTTKIEQKMTEKQFNNLVSAVNKEYKKIPSNKRAGFFIDSKKQTMTVMIKNIKSNTSYKNALVKKFGANKIIFKNALFSERGLVNAKKSVDNFMTNSGYYIAAAGTNEYENKVEIYIVDSEKEAIKVAKAKFKSKAYKIVIITKGQAPVPN